MLHPVYRLPVRSKARRTQWIRLIEEYKQNELSRSAFIKQHGLKMEDFKRWSYRLNKERPFTDKANFIPLSVTTAVSTEVELFHSSGFRLRVGLGSDEAVLKKIIKLLSELPA